MAWLFPNMRRRSREVHDLLEISKKDLDEALTKHRTTSVATAIKAMDSTERATASADRAEGIRLAVESLLEDMRSERRNEDGQGDIT